MIISFLAYLAGTNTQAKWLSVDSEGASKIVLETGAHQLAEVMKMTTLTNKVFRVTITEEK